MANENKNPEDGASKKPNMITDVHVETNDKASVTIHTKTGDHRVVFHRRGESESSGSASNQASDKGAATATQTAPKAETTGDATKDASDPQPGKKAGTAEKQTSANPSGGNPNKDAKTEDTEATERRYKHEQEQLKISRDAKAKMKADKNKSLYEAIDKAHNRAETTFRKGHSIGFWSGVAGFLLGALIVWACWFFFVCSDCSNGTGRVEVVKVLPDEYEVTEDSAGVDTTNQGEGFAPDPDTDDASTEEYEDQEVAESDNITAVSYGEYAVAGEDLVMLVYDCLTSDDMNLRLQAGDKLDGEKKEQLLAAIVSTLLASKKSVDFSTGRPAIREFNYESSGHTQLCDKVSYQAHHIVSYGKYYAPELADESFNFWANIAVDPLQLRAETDFSVAVDETLNVLHKALKERRYTEMNGVKVAVNERRVTRTPRATGRSPTSVTRKKSVRRPPSKSKTRTSLTTAKVPSGFYKNPVPGSTWENNHWDGKTYAVDMMAAKGTPIYASASGEVVKAGWGGKKSGKRVTIRDSNADLFYGHLDVIRVKVGQKVKQGDLIGMVGHTGSAEPDSPHLHLEVFNRKVKSFPRPWTSWKQKQRRT
jgi:murein DD-endopeptidase MepM/ murein hydrolase activator NlpD